MTVASRLSSTLQWRSKRLSLEVIADDDELFRRLAPMMVKRDGTVSSVAYEKNGQPDNEVDLARLTTTT